DNGTYTVTLTVEDNDGATDTITKQITVTNVPPTANFKWTPTNPTDLDTIQFADQSTDLDGTIIEWYWEFGDGDTSTLQNPTHQYKDNGTYIVNLTVWDNDGDSDTISKQISINNIPPSVNFDYLPTSPTDLDTISFTDLSTDSDGTVDAWLWDFGDGNTSTEQNPTHRYGDNGTYTVTLTVWDNDEATNTTSKQITVTNVPPIADFTWTPETPTDLETIQFTDSSTDSDGTIVSWHWDFGDGNISYEQNPTHKYADNGTYTITLTIWDNDGDSDSINKQITVLNVAPEANFTYSPSIPYTSELINFTDLSTDLDGTIVNWTWDFGDGNVSYEQNPQHKYADNGTYNVTLTIVDNDGATNTTYQYITVLNRGPIPDFEWTPANPTDLDVITFTDLSYDTDGWIINYTWNFGDGNISYEQNPTHQYADNGTYTVTLTVTDNDGLSNTASKNIDVLNIPPVANFTWSPETPNQKLDTVQFDSNLSYDPDGTIVNYTWDFGDGNISYEQNPTHVYGDIGNYTITLIVRDNDGATSQKTKTITITNTPPMADFTWTPTNPTDLDIIQFTDESIDSDGEIVAWRWEFDDPNPSDEQNPLHLFVDDGTYNITLTVWDDDGAYNTTTIKINITNVPPIANFTYCPLEPGISESIQFIDLSKDLDGVIVNYTWDFGDGNISYQQNPQHRYTSSGSYLVNLTVTDDDNETNTTTKEIFITNLPPIADFNWTPPNATDLQNINFIDQSYDTDGWIKAWNWSFGDGTYYNTTNPTQKNTTHKYTDNGTYTVTLTVTDNDGATNTTSKQITVSNVAPTAVDDHITIDEDTPVIINVSSNDYDEDGNLDLTSIVVVKQPLHGSTTVNTNGTITYTPNLNYYGYDEFNYTIKDNDGTTSNIATVYITINSVNDAPVAEDDYTATDEDTPIWINIISNDYDIDGTIDTSTISITESPSHGNIDINYTTGEIEYIPDSNYYGLDSFNYTINDNDGTT
ncbi:MAG: hypothetical protein DRN01_06845, partial [Thermoplasmata archaeon]